MSVKISEELISPVTLKPIVYSSPKLTVFGTVSEMTAGGSGTASEDSSSPLGQRRP